MKQLIIIPNGWECLVEECPPGFFVFEDQLCFKSEYDQIFNSAGEYFVTRKVNVQPASYQWVDIEDI